MTEPAAPRPAALAGRWYPDDPDELRAAIDAMLRPASPEAGEPRVLLVPHAGLVYSGPVAGHAYARLRQIRPVRIVVVGQSHYRPTGIEFYGPEPIGTPLGPVPIDVEATAALRARLESFGPTTDDVREEHAVEVQFPFLRRVAPDIPVVPIVVTIGAPESWAALADALVAAGLLEGGVLVASTDLYHGHDRGEAARHGREFARLLEAADREALTNAWRTGEAMVCSPGPVLVAVDAARRLGGSWRVLKLGTSADTAPASDYVVGYAAAAA